MRILLLTPSLPWPPIWGFGTRVLQLSSYLARKNDVTLLTYLAPGDEEKLCEVSKICDVETVPAPSSPKRLEQLASIFGPASFQRRALTKQTMQDKLDVLLKDGSFDLVQVESSQLGGFRFGPGATVVMDEHNLEYELLYRMYQTERNPIRRFYNGLEYRKFRREEEQAWRDCTGLVVTSTREEDIVRQLLPDKLVSTAPNGVDVDYFAPKAPPNESASIVFTGLMRYRPNVDAALFFARTTLPLILRERPDAKFYIVGAGPTEELQRLAGPNIVVTGTVDDVRPFIERASVVVVPLRMGSGTRLKVLEALSMAKPLISTSIGAEGIDVRDGEHLLLRDGPAEMAAGVLQLMREKEYARRLGCAGRELVEREYSWTSVGRSLEQFHDVVLSAN